MNIQDYYPEALCSGRNSDLIHCKNKYCLKIEIKIYFKYKKAYETNNIVFVLFEKRVLEFNQYNITNTQVMYNKTVGYLNHKKITKYNFS